MDILKVDELRGGIDGEQLATDVRRATLFELLREVDASGYDFIAPTPASQSRVIARHDR